MRCSIHEVHLKTCYDSASALAQLIAYIANDKDLMPIDKNTSDKAIPSSVSKSDQNSDDKLDIINKLMADAVKDVETPVLTSSTNEQNDCNTFNSESPSSSYCEKSNMYDYESNIMLQSYYHPSSENSLRQIQDDLEATSITNTSVQDEKDFHVIEENELFFMVRIVELINTQQI